MLLQIPEEILQQKYDAFAEVERDYEKLSIVAREANIAVALMDNNGNYIWINKGYNYVYGFTFEQLLTERGLSIFGRFTDSSIKIAFSRCILQKTTVSYEFAHIKRNGEKIWLQSILTPVVKDGKVVQLIAIDSDISSQKLAEAQTKEQAEMLGEANVRLEERQEEILVQAAQLETTNKELEKLSIVARETDNAILIFDESGCLEWVNTGFTRLYGYTLSEYISLKNDCHMLGMVNIPENRELVERAINEKMTIIYEYPTNTKFGDEIWIQTTLTPIIDVDGNISKFVAIDSDITKLKAAEFEIKKQRDELEKLSIVASKTDNAIAIYDDGGNLEWVNAGFTRLYGYTMERFIEKAGSRNISDFRFNPSVRALIKNCMNNLKSVTFESPTQTLWGNEVWIQTTLTPILNRNGNLHKLIAIDSNINKLKEAEAEIRQQSEEIESQRDELELKSKQLQQQNDNILSSIRYAQTIQSAILPSESHLNSFFKTFVIYRPKDIVSGDFYWFSYYPAFEENGKDKYFFAAVDCTGHGVPGAFMSLIGHRLLNEIVNEKHIDDPATILEFLGMGIQISLNQLESGNDDGMDVCLCLLENESENAFRITFAGAKRPLFYFQHSTNQIHTIKGDSKGIGGKYYEEMSFMNKILILEKNDVLYLTTDGIIDQNNAERRRYGTNRLVEKFISIGNLPLEKQKIEIENDLNSFQGKEHQRDDITILGIKI